MTSMLDRALLSMVLVAAVTLAPAAQAMSEEGALALLGLSQQAGAADAATARDAAYAACLVFGMEPEAMRATLAEAGWAKAVAQSDEYFDVWAPAASEDLLVYLGLNEPVCTVWSNTTGTEEAEQITLGMLQSLELAVDTFTTEDGCPIYAIQPESKIFLSIDSGTDLQTPCGANATSSLTNISFEPVDP